MTQTHPLDAIELSALASPNSSPYSIVSTLSIDLSAFSYISIHAPSQFEPRCDAAVWERLHRELSRGWPIVVHPDAITDTGRWREFGALLCIENMDKRKPIGRTAEELDQVFASLPEASFCFDIGHARQCDPTMTEAVLILRSFGSRLREVHVSEVNTRSKHDTVSYASVLAFQQVAHLIPEDIPLILETPVANEEQMAQQIAQARKSLPVTQHLPVASRAGEWAATLGDKQEKSIRLCS